MAAANVRLMSLRQFERLGCNAGIKCRCGYVTTIDPTVLIACAERHGWTMDKIDMVRSKLRCSKCGVKGQCRIGWSWDKPTSTLVEPASATFNERTRP